MLLKDPDHFAYVAHEWALKWAGATPKNQGSSSGGTTQEDLMKAMQKPKEDERQNPSTYVP